MSQRNKKPRDVGSISAAGQMDLRGAKSKSEDKTADSLSQQPKPKYEFIEQPAERGRRRAPIVYAVELLDEAGVFQCEAYGPELVTVEQLKAWAEKVSASLVLVRWEAKE